MNLKVGSLRLTITIISVARPEVLLQVPYVAEQVPVSNEHVSSPSLQDNNDLLLQLRKHRDVIVPLRFLHHAS